MGDPQNRAAACIALPMFRASVTAFVNRRYHHLEEDTGSLTASDVLPQPVVVRLRPDASDTCSSSPCKHCGTHRASAEMIRTCTYRSALLCIHVLQLLGVQGDLNGDGEPEIIIATHEAKLRVRGTVFTAFRLTQASCDISK